MRIVLCAFGSRGDVQPLLALAVALRSRGHDVVVSAAPDFASWAAELGLAFVTSGINVQEWLARNAEAMGRHPVRILRASKRLMEEQVPVWFDATLAAARGADLIVSASQFAAPSVAKLLGLPIVAVAYAPTLLRSEFHPPMFMTRHGLPRWANRLGWRITEKAAFGPVTRSLNALHERHGLAPIASSYRFMTEGLPVLGAFDPVIAPSPPDWAGRDITVTGPWFYDDPSPLPADVEAFLREGPPPVYVGFGSMSTSDPARTTREIVAGAAAGGRRVLLSKGWAGLGADAPRGVMVVQGPMPHAKLFPRVAAVIHHGGAGTTVAALRSGAPQVLVPHIADQFFHAWRLNALGIAPRGIPVGKLTGARLAQALDAALALAPGPRQEAAARLQAGNGVQDAAQRLERF